MGSFDRGDARRGYARWRSDTFRAAILTGAPEEMHARLRAQPSRDAEEAWQQAQLLEGQRAPTLTGWLPMIGAATIVSDWHLARLDDLLGSLLEEGRASAVDLRRLVEADPVTAVLARAQPGGLCLVWCWLLDAWRRRLVVPAAAKDEPTEDTRWDLTDAGSARVTRCARRRALRRFVNSFLTIVGVVGVSTLVALGALSHRVREVIILALVVGMIVAVWWWGGVVMQTLRRWRALRTGQAPAGSSSTPTFDLPRERSKRYQMILATVRAEANMQQLVADHVELAEAQAATPVAQARLRAVREAAARHLTSELLGASLVP